METVLIAGGTGLIGKSIIQLLLDNHYNVKVLSRHKKTHSQIEYYIWDLKNGFLEENALKNVQHIINLSGENIGNKRWSKKRKQAILESRTRSTQLLFDAVIKDNVALKTFITSSAVGYYGNDLSEKTNIESDPPATDFLGTVCALWEEKSHLFSKESIRTVQIRTGVVLAKEEGVFPKMLKPIKLGVGTVLGSGKQIIPWIHIQDIARIYLWAIQNSKVEGAYNAVATELINNQNFTEILAKKINKKIILPSVPSWFLRIILGEMSELVLKGNKISNEKILKAGFSFQYDSIEKAIENLME